MKARLLLASLLTLFSTISFSQTVIWNETFDPAPGWIAVPIGPNGADPNFFEEDDDEGGVAPPGCGIAGNGNNTLHITSVFFPGGGAAYDAGGLCGVLFCPETATRAESPLISTVGQTNLTLEFDYIHGGQPGADFGGVWYNDGGGWTALQDPLPQTGGACLPQGEWTNFTIALPASCENIPNLQIGFSWVNNDDGVGTDPSIAINNVQITTPSGTPPVAAFNTPTTTICEGDCIDFTDASTLGTNPTWAWTFTGAATGTSNVQNPTGICYNTAGTYDVSLTVTDDNGNDTETQVGYITVVAAPNAGTSTAQNLCNNTTLDLNTLIPGADPGTWVETSGVPSGQFTPGTGVLDGNGLPIGNVYTFDYTVTGTAPCNDVTTTMTITIIDCTGGGPPTAAFTTALTTICEGDCIDFTDNSILATNPTWAWTFTGAATGTSNVQNPTGICYPTAGVYDVSLTVTDDNGNDTETQVGYITVVAAPNAGGPAAQNLCNNQTLDLNTLIPGADPGTWVETSGVPSGQFTPGTGVLDGNGLPIGNVYTFDYTVTGTAPCANATSTMTITIVDCSSGPTTAFSASQTVICEGDCIDFTDNSAFGPNPTWSWTFTGANTPTSNVQNPTNICYDVAGTYTVELTVTDDNGTDTHTEVNYITVNPTPIVTATASPNDTICTGDQVTLTGGGAVSYVWDNGVTDGVPFSPPSTNTYTVIGTDANGCTRNNFIQVVVQTCDTVTANWTVNNLNVCVGQCIDFTDLSTGNIASWTWTFGGGGTPDTVINNPNPTVCFNSTGSFTVNLQVANTGDTSNFSQVINVITGTSVTATLDTIIDLGGTATLVAVGGGPGTYSWSPSTLVDCDTCSTTFASPNSSTDFIVTLTDVNGCTGHDTVMVLVNFVEGIDVPSAFSPNGDGNNDVLYVKGVGIETMTFSIYNRYGQKVFESDNQLIGWDGTFRNRPENSGVFTWMVEYHLINGTTGVLKGNTTLVR